MFNSSASAPDPPMNSPEKYTSNNPGRCEDYGSYDDVEGRGEAGLTRATALESAVDHGIRDDGMPVEQPRIAKNERDRRQMWGRISCPNMSTRKTMTNGAKVTTTDTSTGQPDSASKSESRHFFGMAVTSSATTITSPRAWSIFHGTTNSWKILQMQRGRG
jgi:hypothetical protein